MLTFIQKLSKKKIVIIAVIAVIAVIFGIRYFTNKNNQPSDLITVTKGTIIREVTVTGNTKPVESLDLAFEKGGKINKVYAEVGDKVSMSQVIATLDASDLYAQLREANANIDAQKAQLEELERGARPEDIQIKQTELAKAQQDLANYYNDVPDVVSDAYAKADDAIRKQTYGLFTNEEQANPQLVFSVSDSQLQTDVQAQRVAISNELNEWKKELDSLTGASPQPILDQALSTALSHLGVIRKFLDKTGDALNFALSVSTSTLSTYKTNVNAGRTNVNTALTNVNTQQQNIASQKITVKKIDDELKLKLAGSTAEQISEQAAVVKQAEAKVQGIEAQIAKTILRSPIDGTVTKQDAKVGEIAPANSILVSIISQNKLQIEANIPEADIAKVKINDPATITLDAYGNEVIFEAKVISIDPAETVIEGVATYKTKFQFTREDERVKPGMTANIDILTDKHENVLTVPQRTVTKNNGDEYVMVWNNETNNSEKRVIKTGLRGSDGNVEVLTGLQEGEKITIPQLGK